MTGPVSSLYEGVVLHRRLRPRKHQLRYRVFFLLLDLDEIANLDRRLKLFSRNKRNFFTFHDRDYGSGSGEPLKAQLTAILEKAGIETEEGKILVLTMPRVLGYAFNPLNVYFCYRKDGSLAATVYEVNNTFGQRHSYALPVERTETGEAAVQRCPKSFYVSPFMDMAMTYEFRLRSPGERVSLSITGSDADGRLIVASLSSRRRPLTDWTLVRAFIRSPFLGHKVFAGIHWEALWIWAKGIRIRRRPLPPDKSITFPGTVAGPAKMGDQCIKTGSYSIRKQTALLAGTETDQGSS